MTSTPVPVTSTQWIELALYTPPELVEALANFLIDEGSNGVVIEDLQTYDDFADRRRMGWLWVKAYFPKDDIDALKGRLDTFLSELADLFPLSEPPVLDQRTPETQDWSECWKHFFKPMMLSDRMMICPSWEKVVPPTGTQRVLLDPGMAFGTGKHPSTRLCIRALETQVLFPTEEQPPKKVFSLLDVGTGSGILSIASAKLGVPRVLGIDIDPQAITAATANVAMNALEHRVEISDETLTDLMEEFDVVLANIVADTLIQMKKQLVSRLAPTGMLILSGILRNQGAWLKHEFLMESLTFVEALHDDDWCALVFQKI